MTAVFSPLFQRNTPPLRETFADNTAVPPSQITVSETETIGIGLTTIVPYWGILGQEFNV